MAYVLKQGNFGSKQTDVERKVTFEFNAHHSLDQWLQILQFSGMNHWEAVKRYPVLKPFAWIYGAGRYAHLALGRKNGIALVRQEKKKSDQLDELREALGLQGNKTQVVLQGDQFVEQKR